MIPNSVQSPSKKAALRPHLPSILSSPLLSSVWVSHFLRMKNNPVDEKEKPYPKVAQKGCAPPWPWAHDGHSSAQRTPAQLQKDPHRYSHLSSRATTHTIKLLLSSLACSLACLHQPRLIHVHLAMNSNLEERPLTSHPTAHSVKLRFDHKSTAPAPPCSIPQIPQPRLDFLSRFQNRPKVPPLYLCINYLPSLVFQNHA
jgi:hypothetical protein